MIEFESEEAKDFYEKWVEDMKLPSHFKCLYVLGQATIVNNYMSHSKFQDDLIKLAEELFNEADTKAEEKD